MREQGSRHRLLALMRTSGLPHKALARAAGRTEDTIRNWLDETSVPNMDAADGIIAALIKAGLADAREHVFGTAAPTGDACYWLTERGEALAAPAGLNAFVRDALALPPDMGDEAAYARRTLGWIGWTLRADGLLLIEIERGLVDPAAVARARDLAAGQVDRVKRVRITAHQAGASAARDYDWLPAALDALDRSAVLMPVVGQHLLRRAIEMPIALEAIDLARRHLLDACRVDADAGEILAAAQRAGLGDRTAMVKVGDDGSARLLYAGPGVMIRPEAIGREAGEMDDIVYGDALRRQMQAVARCGRACTRVMLEADDARASYTRVALRGAGNIVVTANVVDAAPAGARVG